MLKNERNFTALHNRLYAKVFSFVRLRIKDKEEVKDIVQDVFMRAYKSWEDIPDESSAKNFLYIIARQRMIDIWRSARFRTQSDLPGTRDEDGDGWEEVGDFDSLESQEPLPEEVFEKSESKEGVLKLLNKLKEDEREILVLRFLEEMEYKELSKIYKTSEDNIRQKVSRSLQKLRKCAQDENSENKKVEN